MHIARRKKKRCKFCFHFNKSEKWQAKQRKGKIGCDTNEELFASQSVSKSAEGVGVRRGAADEIMTVVTCGFHRMGNAWGKSENFAGQFFT